VNALNEGKGVFAHRPGVRTKIQARSLILLTVLSTERLSAITRAGIYPFSLAGTLKRIILVSTEDANSEERPEECQS
jgi:hypothetical protein